MGLLIAFAAFAFAISIHESAHGLIAYYKGDTTAHDEGRISLNPIRHIDPFGTIALPIMFFLAGLPPFGYAKPVNIRAFNLTNPRRDMMYVALAGPVSNILAACGFAVMYHVFVRLQLAAFAAPLEYFVVVNLYLGIFNCIPIPPLDGSRVLLGLLPPARAAQYARLERYGFIILFVLLYLGIIRILFVPLVNMLLRILL